MNDITSESTSLYYAMTSKHKLDKIMMLDEIDYSDKKCKEVFVAIKDIYKKGKIVDVMSVRSNCNVDDTFIANIMQAPTTQDIDGLIEKLREYTQKREVLKIGSKLDEFKNKKVTPSKMINDIYDHIKNVEDMNFTTFDHISEHTSQDVSYFELNENDCTKTGFSEWDNTLFGLVNSELTILGARTGLGKSAMALNVATNVARKKRVLYISLEMVNKLLSLRILSSTSGVDSWRIRKGKLNDEEMVKVIKTSEKANSLMLSLVDDAFTLDSILSKIRKFHSMYKDVVIIVDYIQMIRVPGIENKRLQVAEISGSLKQLCNKLNIPILALAQLSRNAEGIVPKLSDLKEAGDLEQDADNVIFLHNTIDMGNVYDFLIAKGRSSGVGNSQILFDKSIVKFKNYSKDFNDCDYINN